MGIDTGRKAKEVTAAWQKVMEASRVREEARLKFNEAWKKWEEVKDVSWDKKVARQKWDEAYLKWEDASRAAKDNDSRFKCPVCKEDYNDSERPRYMPKAERRLGLCPACYDELKDTVAQDRADMIARETHQ